MMASLLYDGDGESESATEAVRVMDADLADVFFVPFFSSLSFNVHVRNMAEIDTVDEKLQVRFLLELNYFCIYNYNHLFTG